MKSELSKFLRYLETERGLSPGTIEAYRLDLERGLIRFLLDRGKSETKQVTKHDIRSYLDLQASKGNSNATRARKLAAIKSFFRYLVETEEVEASPAASIRSPRIPEREPVYLANDEIIHLMKTIDREARPWVCERDTAMVIVFLHTGLRVSELTNLKLVNVDLDRGEIKITRKGNKEQYLHLNGQTVRALQDYLTKRPEALNGNLFVRRNGADLSRTYVYSMVRRYMKLAGIDKGKRGPHIFRHTFCTRLHQKGVPVLTIKELAGHKRLDTTMRYVKIENKEQAEAIDSLEFCMENLCYNNGDGNIERQDEAMDKVENYLGLNDKYIKEGDALLAKGDYVQASEKFWGAAAEVVKAVAAKRDADIQSHGGLFRFITTLSKELNDSDLLRSFSLAGALHQNFYENWLTSEIVVDHSKAVKSLVKKLEKLAR